MDGFRKVLWCLALMAAGCSASSSHSAAKPELRPGSVFLGDMPAVDNAGREVGDELVSILGVTDAVLDGNRIVAMLESVSVGFVEHRRFLVSDDRGSTWNAAAAELTPPWWTAAYGGFHASAGRTTVRWDMTDGTDNWVQLQDVDPTTGAAVPNPAIDGVHWPAVGTTFAVPGALLNLFDNGGEVIIEVYDMATGTPGHQTVSIVPAGSAPRMPAGTWTTTDGNDFWAIGNSGCMTRMFRDGSQPSTETCLPNPEAFPDWLGAGAVVLPGPVPQAFFDENGRRAWSFRLDSPPANAGGLGDLGARVGPCSMRGLLDGMACTDTDGRFLGEAADGSFVDVRLPASPCDSEHCGQEWSYDSQVALGGGEFVVFRAVNDYEGVGMHWSAYASRETATRTPWTMAVRTRPDEQTRAAPALFEACTAAQHCFGPDVVLAGCIAHWTVDVPFDSPSYAAFVNARRDDCEAIAAAWPDQALLSAYAAGATCTPGCVGDAWVVGCQGENVGGYLRDHTIIHDCAALGGRCLDGACAVSGADACMETFPIDSQTPVAVGCASLGMTCRPTNEPSSGAPCVFQGCANTCEGSVRVRCEPGQSTSTKLDCAAFGTECVVSGNTANCIPNVSPNRWNYCDSFFLWEPGEAGYFVDCRTLGGTLCTTAGPDGPHCL